MSIQLGPPRVLVLLPSAGESWQIHGLQCVLRELHQLEVPVLCIGSPEVWSPLLPKGCLIHENVPTVGSVSCVDNVILFSGVPGSLETLRILIEHFRAAHRRPKMHPVDFPDVDWQVLWGTVANGDRASWPVRRAQATTMSMSPAGFVSDLLMF